MSKFTSAAVEKALDALEKEQENTLEAMFEAAAKEEKKNSETREWMNSDRLNDIEGWEWNDETEK